jgi:hypothetical protein
MNTARKFSRCRNTNSSFRFWWKYTPPAGASTTTEEYDGTNWTTGGIL